MKKIVVETLSMIEILNYEIRAAGWPHYIPWPFAQDLAGRYFAWKTKRKYARYLQSMQEKAECESHRPLNPIANS